MAPTYEISLTRRGTDGQDLRQLPLRRRALRGGSRRPGVVTALRLQPGLQRERSIRPTQDFEFELLANVRRSHVLTAVVGARWLTATHETGGLRLTDGNDWVRREIVEAFSHGVRVVPVLVGNVAHLRPRELPGALAALARCQYLRLRHRDIVPDLCRLKAVVALLLS
jgi:hypothetical protein